MPIGDDLDLFEASEPSKLKSKHLHDDQLSHRRPTFRRVDALRDGTRVDLTEFAASRSGDRPRNPDKA